MQEVDINGAKHFIPENFLINLGGTTAQGPNTNTFVKIPNQTTPTGSGPAGSQGTPPATSTSSTSQSTPSNTGTVVINPAAVVTHTAKTPRIPVCRSTPMQIVFAQRNIGNGNVIAFNTPNVYC